MNDYCFIYIYIYIYIYIDRQLKPIVMQVKSYIKDTDFLKKLRDFPDLPEDSIICTIDVVVLYASIPYEMPEIWKDCYFN